MVVRIDVIEGRGEVIGIFLHLFFNFNAPGKSSRRRQYTACVQLSSRFILPPLRQKPLLVLDKNRVRKHIGSCCCGESKKTKENHNKKSTVLEVFLSYPVVLLMRFLPSSLYRMCFCLQDGLHKKRTRVLLGSSMPSQKPPRGGDWKLAPEASKLSTFERERWNKKKNTK